MSIFRKSNPFSSSPSPFYRFQSLVLELQRWNHTVVGEGGAGTSTQFRDGDSVAPVREDNSGLFNTFTSRTVNSRNFGIGHSSISSSTWMVLKLLKEEGFEVYLVGGCVRDLILKRIPKDYDVVTTATLEQIRKKFHRCRVVGRRFPICQVHIFGSMIEVSSFHTTHIDSDKRLHISQMPNNLNSRDFVRWKDSMRRDFTINGLYYDPFVYTIYDYVDGIKDILTSKVRTVLPAHLSFTEDCARILRGLRIVARLGLQFSVDTDIAVQDLSSLILTLDKARLMMEVNFMLAYGAAVPSIRLLQKYKLLDLLLPIQAAYLADQNEKQPSASPTMLMKLFSHVDVLLAADRPSTPSLWLGLLAFHLALVNHPQNAFVVWTFSTILYLGSWNKAIKFVRENVKGHVQFVPEIQQLLSESQSNVLLQEDIKSDELLLEETSCFASMIKSSVDALISAEALQQSLARYKETFPCSALGHLIFVSDNIGRRVVELFDVFESDLKSYAKERNIMEIDYELLKKGDPDETRFVLGKVIFDTMNSELTCQETSPLKSVHSAISNFQNNPSTVIKLMRSKPIHHQSEAAIEVKKIVAALSNCQDNDSRVVRSTNNRVVKEKNQNVAAVKKEEDSDSRIIKSMNREAVKEKNQNVVAAVKKEEEKNQNVSAVKKKEDKESRIIKLVNVLKEKKQNVAVMEKKEKNQNEAAVKEEEEKNQNVSAVKKKEDKESRIIKLVNVLKEKKQNVAVMEKKEKNQNEAAVKEKEDDKCRVSKLMNGKNVVEKKNQNESAVKQKRRTLFDLFK